jgi:hypothetical protein
MRDLFIIKGLTVSPHLWPQFRKALAKARAALIQEGWLDLEDFEINPSDSVEVKGEGLPTVNGSLG